MPTIGTALLIVPLVTDIGTVKAVVVTAALPADNAETIAVPHGLMSGIHGLNSAVVATIGADIVVDIIARNLVVCAASATAGVSEVLVDSACL